MIRKHPRIAVAVTAVVVFVVVVLGFVTDTIPDELLQDQAHATIGLVRQNGEAAAVALLYLEESGVPMPVPGDAFVMFLGHRLAKNFLLGILVSLGITAAVVLGASNLYVISRRWGRRIVSGRTGRVIHVTPKRLERAERWFQRWGMLALIFGRHIPGFRVPITVAAGIFRLDYRIFALSVAISTITWSSFFLLVGHALGGRVSDFILLHRRASMVTLAVVVAAVVVYVAIRVAQLGGFSPRRRAADHAGDRSSRP